MALQVVAPELARWDTLWAEAGHHDALALSFFLDERPLRGAAGLADWRLCGRLSRLLRAGKLTGIAGETTMVPPAGHRLGVGRIFLFGLGESHPFDEGHYRAAVRRMRDVLARAAVNRYLVQPPGRATSLISARRAFELWSEEAEADGVEAEVTLIESLAGQKEMSEAQRVRRPTTQGAGLGAP